MVWFTIYIGVNNASESDREITNWRDTVESD
jgi:hypothetical protein